MWEYVNLERIGGEGILVIRQYPFMGLVVAPGGKFLLIEADGRYQDVPFASTAWNGVPGLHVFEWVEHLGRWSLEAVYPFDDPEACSRAQKILGTLRAKATSSGVL